MIRAGIKRIRNAPPVSEQPAAALDWWMILAVDADIRIVFGRVAGTGSWRTTTPIADLDATDPPRWAITESGRRYDLGRNLADAPQDVADDAIAVLRDLGARVEIMPPRERRS